MPRYQYECNNCNQEFEKQQRFSEDPLTDCPMCGTENSVERVITSVGVIFKGSGFYINDSKSGSKKDKSSTLSSNGDTAKTETKDTTKTDNATSSEKATESKPEAKAEKASD